MEKVAARGQPTDLGDAQKEKPKREPKAEPKED
jgi:hypothetical protein